MSKNIISAAILAAMLAVASVNPVAAGSLDPAEPTGSLDPAEPTGSLDPAEPTGSLDPAEPTVDPRDWLSALMLSILGDSPR